MTRSCAGALTSSRATPEERELHVRAIDRVTGQAAKTIVDEAMEPGSKGRTRSSSARRCSAPNYSGVKADLGRELEKVVMDSTIYPKVPPGLEGVDPGQGIADPRNMLNRGREEKGDDSTAALLILAFAIGGNDAAARRRWGPSRASSTRRATTSSTRRWSTCCREAV